MPYIPLSVVQEVKRMDLLTYLKNYEPYELVHFSGNTYTTRTHDAFGLPHRFPVWQSAAACQGESLKPSENEKGESNNVEVYLWSISRWHYRSSVDVLVAD